MKYREKWDKNRTPAMQKIPDHYIPQIDGLRGIAITAVLLFHFVPYRFPGGYIGVDVFFVISGYLISGIIFKNINNRNFSLSLFYYRRFRRLYPALLTTVFFTVLLSSLLMSPQHLERIGKSAFASIFFVPNIFLWSESGYFDIAGAFKPLLHFWSLGVEEQFYWIWPLFLPFIYKRCSVKTTLATLVLTGVASFIASGVVTTFDKTSTFYLTPFRVFEFVLGALCNFSGQKRLDGISPVTGLIGGLLIIGYSILFFDSKTAFPGFAAALPCLGAALIILTCESLPGRLALANKPIVLLGKISYSLYLVHWPVLVFYKYWKADPLTLFERAVLLGIAVALATSLYFLVEKRYRLQSQTIGSRGKHRSSSFIFLLALVTMAFGTYAFASKGMPWRIAGFSPQETNMPQEFCKNLEQISEYEKICRIPGTNNRPKVLFIGDSHANQFMPAFNYLSEKYSLDITYWTHWGCPPLWRTLKTRVDHPEREVSCANAVRSWEAEATSGKYDFIVLAARWMWVMEPTTYGTMRMRRDYLIDQDTPVRTVEASRELFTERLQLTIESLVQAGSKVIIFSQVPLLSRNIQGCNQVPRLLYSEATLKRRCRAGVALEEQITRLAFTDTAIENLASQNILPIIPSHYLCSPPDPQCATMLQDSVLYMDDNHLNPRGSILFIKMVEPLLEKFFFTDDAIAKNALKNKDDETGNVRPDK